MKPRHEPETLACMAALDLNRAVDLYRDAVRPVTVSEQNYPVSPMQAFCGTFKRRLVRGRGYEVNAAALILVSVIAEAAKKDKAKP